eukprot:jgi/Ulvmu1/3615/UM017_0027.1
MLAGARLCCGRHSCHCLGTRPVVAQQQSARSAAHTALASPECISAVRVPDRPHCTPPWQLRVRCGHSRPSTSFRASGLRDVWLQHECNRTGFPTMCMHAMTRRIIAESQAAQMRPAAFRPAAQHDAQHDRRRALRCRKDGGMHIVLGGARTTIINQVYSICKCEFKFKVPR